MAPVRGRTTDASKKLANTPRVFVKKSNREEGAVKNLEEILCKKS